MVHGVGDDEVDEEKEGDEDEDDGVTMAQGIMKKTAQKYNNDNNNNIYNGIDQHKKSQQIRTVTIIKIKQ